jgi:hypothetical protein
MNHVLKSWSIVLVWNLLGVWHGVANKAFNNTLIQNSWSAANIAANTSVFQRSLCVVNSLISRADHEPLSCIHQHTERGLTFVEVAQSGSFMPHDQGQAALSLFEYLLGKRPTPWKIGFRKKASKRGSRQNLPPFFSFFFFPFDFFRD